MILLKEWRLDMISIDKICNSEKLCCLDSDFCWSNIKYIDSIDYRILYDECYEAYSLIKIGFIYDGKTYAYNIVFEFYNAQNIYINKLGGKYNQILGFEIIDKSKDGWCDDQRYQINDYEDNTISFSCEDIKILSVEKKEIY